MVVAAFVMSVLAILVAGVSVLYVRSQALAAKEVAVIERSRHLKERTPTFEAEIESVNQGGWFRLWLRLTSDVALEQVGVELDVDSGIVFTSGQEGVDPSGSSPRRARLGAVLAQNELAAWRIALPEKRPLQLRLLVHGRAGADSWQVPLAVPVLGDITDSMH